jgi:hypothetical protein
VPDGELFRRDYTLRIQTEQGAPDTEVAAVEIRNLDIMFNVEKSLRQEPNTASITVYNLGADTRRAIEKMSLYDPEKKLGAPRQKSSDWSGSKARLPKPGLIRVELEAGYVGSTSLIFRGDLRRAVSTRDADGSVRTTIEGEDGGLSVLAGRIRETFPAGTTTLTVVKACLEAMGLGTGNLIEVEDILANQRLSHATTLYGLASDQLSGILRRLGVRWSVQSGAIRFQPRKIDTARGVLLSADTGMVGSPHRDAKGNLVVKSLLHPGLSCGGFVQVYSIDAQHNGSFQVDKITYEGESAGGSWYCEMELKPA